MRATDSVRIEFPGNLQGRNIRENGAKGCLLVTVDSARRLRSEFQALDVFRWSDIAVDAAAATSSADALDHAIMVVNEARAGADGRPLAARVHLTCSPNVYRQAIEDLS